MREDFVIGKCDKCGVEFRYYLVHNGFNETAYAYCNKCGKVCFLFHYAQNLSDEFRKKIYRLGYGYNKIDSRLETLIEKCSCGGSFTHDSSPRCPACNSQLSAEAAREYIEANASGTKVGWRWQGNWDDADSIVIEKNAIEDNWKLYPPKMTFKEKIKLFFFRK